jgi:hypothetical protein
MPRASSPARRSRAGAAPTPSPPKTLRARGSLRSSRGLRVGRRPRRVPARAVGGAGAPRDPGAGEHLGARRREAARWGPVMRPRDAARAALRGDARGVGRTACRSSSGTTPRRWASPCLPSRRRRRTAQRWPPSWAPPPRTASRRSTPWRAFARRARRWCRCSPTRASAAARGRRRGPHLRGGSPTWRYLFAQPLESAMPAVRALGAWHGLELLVRVPAHGPLRRARGAHRPRRRALRCSATWTRFAAAGDPGGDAPVARATAPGMEPTLRIAATPAVEPGWRNTRSATGGTPC